MSSEEFLVVEGAFEKLPPSWKASSELQGVIEQLDFLHDVSRQILDEFHDVSRSIDDIQFTIRMS